VKNGAAVDLEAVPVAGGAPIVLQAGIVLNTDSASAFVSGGAVAWYSGTTATGLATSVNIWTKAAGKKTVATPTRSGIFAASTDGALVAFATNATATTTDIAITTAAAPSAATPALSTVTFAPNSAAKGCPTRIRFAGTTFVGAYCTGINAAATAAKLVTVAAGGAPVVRVDNAVAAASILPVIFADNTGTKLFVVGPAPTYEGRVVVTAGANTTVTAVDADITAVDVAKDGSAAVYLTGAGALKKASFAAVPVVTPIIPTGVLSLLGMSADSKKALFSTLTNADPAFKLTDAKVVDVTAAVPAPVVIEATATGRGFGFTGTGGYVIYTDTFDANTGLGKLNSKPVTGGAEKILDPATFGGFGAEVGTGVISVPAIAADKSWTVTYVDAVAGGALQAGAADVSPNDWVWSGKSFVHTNLGAAASGVYALTLP